MYIRQSKKLTCVDSASETPDLGWRLVESTTKPISEFRFRMGIPAGEPDEILLPPKISIVAIIAITSLLETEN